MTPADMPLFEVVTAAEDAEARRLVTAAEVRTIIGSPEGDDNTIETLIDGATALCARFCGLANAATSPITFGQEALRATWLATTFPRSAQLLLPWRVPVTAVAIEEAGTELEEGAFRIRGTVLERIVGGALAAWSSSAIVVEYTAGWILPDDDGLVPADLKMAVIDQVKMQYAGRTRDLGLRSEDIPGVWSGTYNVAGGDSIGRSGLLISVEDALTPYRKWAIG